MVGNNIPRVCHYCLYRHSGCGEDVLKTYRDGYCNEFKLGACFFCDVFKANGNTFDENICTEAYVWNYCGSKHCFKGDYPYDNESSNVKGNINKSFTFKSEQEKQRYLKRRIRTKHHKSKMRRKADENKYIRGPWFDEDKNRVVIGDRGKISKWLKNQSNKRLRREVLTEDSILYRGSSYKKLFDYWWELD